MTITLARISRYLSMTKKVTNYCIKLKGGKKERKSQEYISKITCNLFKVENLLRELQEHLTKKEV